MPKRMQVYATSLTANLPDGQENSILFGATDDERIAFLNHVAPSLDDPYWTDHENRKATRDEQDVDHPVAILDAKGTDAVILFAANAKAGESIVLPDAREGSVTFKVSDKELPTPDGAGPELRVDITRKIDGKEECSTVVYLDTLQMIEEGFERNEGEMYEDPFEALFGGLLY